jgi:hypothetical protein
MARTRKATKQTKPSKLKPAKPRGDFRARWDMSHKNPKTYNRKNNKQTMNETITAEEINTIAPDYIECSFRPISEFICVSSGSTGINTSVKTKFGRYHGSSWNFEIKNYPIAAWIDVDYSTYLNQGLTEEDIFIKCVAYLNMPPERKRKSNYGNLIPRRASFKKDDNGDEYISVLITTDDAKNKNFWGGFKKKSKKFS